MKSKKNKVALMSLVSISYFSCEKTGNAAYCDGVVCENGGYCLKGQCLCPTGYEDSACSSTTVSKYIGTWRVQQTIIGSDTAKLIGTDSIYYIDIKQSATSTAFFINNFLNNNEYNQVVCTINNTNSYTFYIDTTTNAAMRFASIHFWGGTGKITLGYFTTGDRHPILDTIVGGFVFKFINPRFNWQVDTMAWKLSRVL